MQLVTVDGSSGEKNNARVNIVDVARRVRALRAEKDITQEALAKRAKISIGTLQSLEGGKRRTSDTNIERVAKALGTTFKALTEDGEAVQPSDPLLAGLNREDLLVARLYHDATTAVRQRVLAIVNERESDVDADEQATGMAARIMLLPANARTGIELFLSQLVPEQQAPAAAATNTESSRHDGTRHK